MTGAYFGARCGCEPVHILWDSHADVIKVANNTAKPTGKLTARMHVHSMEGRELYARSAIVDLMPTSVADVFPIQRPTTVSGVFFVKLALERADTAISENFYWSSFDGGSCNALNSLPSVTLAAQARRSQTRDTIRFTVNLTNSTQAVALAIRLKVQRAVSGQRVLPVFYSDNYFGLLPGEAKLVTLELAERSLAGEAPGITVEGWNIQPQRIPIL